MSSVTEGLGLELPAKYGHFIGGKFVEPAEGNYFDNVSPIDGKVFIQAARGTTADIDAAVYAAKAAFLTWSKVSVTERSNVLLKVIFSSAHLLGRPQSLPCMFVVCARAMHCRYTCAHICTQTHSLS